MPESGSEYTVHSKKKCVLNGCIPDALLHTEVTRFNRSR